MLRRRAVDEKVFVRKAAIQVCVHAHVGTCIRAFFLFLFINEYVE